MTKAEIVERIAAGTGLTRVETEAVVDGFLTMVRRALIEEDGVEIRGFGSFRVQHRAPRAARNPRTNEVVGVEERYVPVFKASRDLREAVDASYKAGTRS